MAKSENVTDSVEIGSVIRQKKNYDCFLEAHEDHGVGEEKIKYVETREGDRP